MSFTFRKRIKILPGIHLNLSKSGLGLGIGPKGAGITLSPNRRPQAHVAKGGLGWRWTLGKKR